MTVAMDFNREAAEQMVAVAMGVPFDYTKKMTDEELLNKAFRLGCRVYGFENPRVVSE